MKIAVIGTGYVGLVVGTCLADFGNEVICIDVDENKINKLNNGEMPIYEPGLKDLVDRNTKEGRLFFTTDFVEGINGSKVIFIAVGTPEDKDHRADLSFVKSVATNIGKHMNNYTVIVNKSTVPVGTAEMVERIIKENQAKPVDFDVVSNPEFLKEGSAIKDFQNPDRVVVGADSEKAKEIMSSLYNSVARINRPIIFTDIKSAEIIKYASNSMLAARISFMNELSHLCEKVGADIKKVALGVGLDNRIGSRFLQAGVGYGGSCFPKDVKAFIQTMRDNDCEAKILEAVESVNERQKKVLIPKINLHLSDIKGKLVAVWGLAFKPRTDDIREAPSLHILDYLLKSGAKVRAFDPVAAENMKKKYPEIHYTENPFEAVKGAELLIIMTEWDEFRNLDKEKLKSFMNNPNIIDGRNIYDPNEMKKLGFNYKGVGR